MLDTLLEIGKTLRNAENFVDALKHHRYIKQAPKGDEKMPVRYISIPVGDDGIINAEKQQEITNENAISKLFYLTYKSGEADSLVKYIYGDLLYGLDKDGNATGYYKRGDKENKQKAFQKNSFERGTEDAVFFNDTVIKSFRESFQQNYPKIEKLLADVKPKESIFIHFDFNGKHWYELHHEMEQINKKLLQEFVLKSEQGGYILGKFIYKTLAAGGRGTPNFSSSNSYRNKLFPNIEDVLDLIYAIDYSKKALISERNIKIIILPRGEKLQPEQIEKFFERGKNSMDDAEQAEEQFAKEHQESSQDNFLDSMFDAPLTNTSANIEQFDFIFSKRGDSASSPDVDLVEISGIQKSLLAHLSGRIRDIRFPLQKERDEKFPKRPKDFIGLEIRSAFYHILADTTKKQNKYQSHLFKVLPQIYTGTYYRDDKLLPALIEKTEFNIRNDSPNFNLLKYDYQFLCSIRNTGDNTMQEMIDSPSYKAGFLLGKMAQPVRQNIASFEKNYVGLLSRRISDLSGVISFAGFLNEKLNIHESVYRNLQEKFVELAGLIKTMPHSSYNKQYCAFGFFEGYYSFEKKAGENPEIPTTKSTN